jgi:hypothetical protein
MRWRGASHQIDQLERWTFTNIINVLFVGEAVNAGRTQQSKIPFGRSISQPMEPVSV